jgi:16S rRNA C967 or C1407 C5-methylase (RsmB/RsmF family)/NOL1/NOP2/fmu family ribosome biogenesis protein
MSLPTPFVEVMRAQLGASECVDFEAALGQSAPVSLRLNVAKNAPTPTPSRPIAWHSDGFYLPERPVFTLDPAFHAGAYYVQEASSMFVAEVLRQTCETTQPLRVLDLCAAPGGKSTLLAAALTPDSLLVTNEVVKARVEILKENIQKWGLPNVVVANHTAAEMLENGMSNFFDVILVDAPCSGEGMFRKDPKSMGEWSEYAVTHCVARQKDILTTTAQLLKTDGVLLYSTCTYNDSENSDNVRWLEATQDFTFLPLQNLPLGVVARPRGYQFYPHRIEGEGFFIAALRKNAISSTRKINTPQKFKNLEPLPKAQVTALDTWIQTPEQFRFFSKANGEIVAIPTALTADAVALDYFLTRKALGTVIGTFKGKDFIAAHALALSVICHPNITSLDLSQNEALQFLKKNNLDFPTAPQGWTLLKYNGMGLGWVKILSNRVNNYLPASFRIRMEIGD